VSDLVPPGELVYNPYAFAVHDDPYAVYARLSRGGPPYWKPDCVLGRMWKPLRLMCLEAFREFGTFSSTGGVGPPERPSGDAEPGRAAAFVAG
jgi:hypothetical protein